MTSGVKKTRKQIKKEVNILGYKLLKEYYPENDIGHHNRSVIIEDKFGYKYDVMLQNLIKWKIRIVDKNNPFSLKNISNWLRLNNKEFKLCKNNVYKGSGEKLRFCHFKKCKEYFSMSWHNILCGQGCPICRGLQIGKFNNLAYLRPELIKEWSSKNKLKPEEVTLSSDKRVKWICSNCNHKWIAKIIERTRNDNKETGCPQCSSSKGEKRIAKFLKNNKFYYNIEHWFTDCKYKNYLYFDFYIKKYNTCIEYHGPHHYRPVDFAGKGYKWAKNQFRLIKKRDKIKANYCKKKHIKLITIPYWKFSKIDEILTRKIFKKIK